MEDHPGKGYVFIAGGIGAAPVMSMLRTLADRGDHAAAHVLLRQSDLGQHLVPRGARGPAGAAQSQGRARLERPPEGWAGETGYISQDVLKRHAPFDLPNSVYFICGPLPMVRGVMRALHVLQIPRAHCHAEQFEMA